MFLLKKVDFIYHYSTSFSIFIIIWYDLLKFISSISAFIPLLFILFTNRLASSTASWMLYPFSTGFFNSISSVSFSKSFIETFLVSSVCTSEGKSISTKSGFLK